MAKLQHNKHKIGERGAQKNRIYKVLVRGGGWFGNSIPWSWCVIGHIVCVLFCVSIGGSEGVWCVWNVMWCEVRANCNGVAVSVWSFVQNCSNYKFSLDWSGDILCPRKVFILLSVSGCVCVSVCVWSGTAIMHDRAKCVACLKATRKTCAVTDKNTRRKRAWRILFARRPSHQIVYLPCLHYNLLERECRQNAFSYSPWRPPSNNVDPSVWWFTSTLYNVLVFCEGLRYLITS